MGTYMYVVSRKNEYGTLARLAMLLVKHTASQLSFPLVFKNFLIHFIFNWKWQNVDSWYIPVFPLFFSLEMQRKVKLSHIVRKDSISLLPQSLMVTLTWHHRTSWNRLQRNDLGVSLHCNKIIIIAIYRI